MSALTHLPRIAGITLAGAAIAATASSGAMRDRITSILPTILSTRNPWRLAAILLALLNLKNLPLMWHVRVFRSMIYQLYLQPTKLPADALFRPIITRTAATPLAECDYNGHKSNSTYFSDFDVSRAQLVSCLLRKGITTQTRQLREGLDKGEGGYMIALGAVHCSFKKEVKPYQGLEVWTRVLAWDRKWIYLVSHLVRPGVAKPTEWALTPWRRSKPGRKSTAAIEGEAQTFRQAFNKAIFATSISKYVVKRGRRTIAPEIVLQRSDLLPPKPSTEDTGASTGGDSTNFGVQSLHDADVDAGATAQVPCLSAGTWDWEHVERERLRGLKLAEKFGALDALHEEFPVAGGADMTAGVGVTEVLGEYGDLLW